jgi:CRP-like cAMP-binding protein
MESERYSEIIASDNPLHQFKNLLSEEEMDFILASSNRVDYGRRDIILKQSTRVSHIPFIVNGLVKVTREMRKGKTIILRIEKPSTFLGLSSVYGGETYDYSAIAIEPTSVLFIDSLALRRVLESNGIFAFEIIQRFSQRNLFNTSRLTSLLYKQLPGRVADIILYFSEDIYGSQTFNFPLTRQELAELAGTTKESFIRTLSEFKNDKIIAMEKNAVTISSLSIIKTLSRLG